MSNKNPKTSRSGIKTRSFAKFSLNIFENIFANSRTENPSLALVGKLSRKSTRAKREAWTTDSDAMPAALMTPRMRACWMECGVMGDERMWIVDVK